MTPASGGTPSNRPTLAIRAGTAAELGDARVGVSSVTASEATLVHENEARVSTTQVVAAGDLLAVSGLLYRVAAIRPGSGSVTAPGSDDSEVVIEREPLSVPGVSLRPDGLLLTSRGFLYLGPGRSQLSGLAISGDTITFKVGSRTSSETSPVETRLGAAVTIDRLPYRVSQLWPADKNVGTTGWLELAPMN